jgi:chondroitin sulfate proteoglycan 4
LIAGCLSGGFSLQLSDGQNTGQRAEFQVRVKQVSLQEINNNQLSVFPGLEAAITPRDLLVATTDGDSANRRQVVFLVTSGPTRGRLLYLTDSGRYETVQNFTQEAINGSRLIYRHEPSSPFGKAGGPLRETDAFSFEAISDHAPYRLKSMFRIVISVTSRMAGGIERYVRLSPVLCQEGGNATVFPQNLNTSGILNLLSGGGPLLSAPVRMQLSSLPLHGKLNLRGGPARQGDTFSQADVDSGALVYTHDHSDSTTDRIGLAIYITREGLATLSGGGTEAKDVTVFEGQLNVSVTPVNDRQPYLVTNNPSMVVVRGQAKIIGRDLLEVRDPDTGPEGIRYTILDNGLQGRLVHPGQQQQGSLTHFTQQDINEDRVVYVHDGASAQTQFYFSVTDGRFQPRETGLSRHFRIHVIPLTLRLVFWFCVNALR